MVRGHPLVIDRMDWQKFMPNLPVLTSYQSGWSSILIEHYRLPLINLPEVSNLQHVVIIPLGHQAVDFEFTAEGRSQTVSYREEDYTSGCIEIYPADLPISFHSHPTVQAMEAINCYLDPTFVAQIAHESVNPDRVELLLTLKTVDVLLHQIGLALRASLEADGARSRFYADSMATAMAAHLIYHYSTRKHHFREHEDGLPKQQLRQAIEYIQAHLGEDISLSDIATALGMSQYYFCHLFKRSTGISPHQFLIRHRVEQAKLLLKKPERTVLSIALECGFANQSHFARCFRQCTGVTPNQFRKS